MDFSKEQIPENEKVILTLLRQMSIMSKGEISSQGHMAWATAVKLIERLKKRGWIVEEDAPGGSGKPGRNGQRYRLNRETPVAVGVDVEYSSTKIILTNLQGDILSEREHPTPQHPTVSSLQEFLKEYTGEFISSFVKNPSALKGIGIGVPGVVIPAWIKPDAGEKRRQMEDYLADVFQLPVAIEINVRAYTNNMKWQNLYFPGMDFLLLSIRTGIGMGVIHRGERVVGHQFIGGEIGHIKVTDEPIVCRCGGTGCLETVVNDYQLYRLFRRNVIESDREEEVGKKEIEKGVSALFTAAAEGNVRAIKVLESVAEYIAKALSSCLMMLFIPQVILCGHFGPDGQTIIPMIQAEMKKRLLPSMEVRMVYHSFERNHYALGAALLLLENYLDFNSIKVTKDSKDIGLR